jgi:hypothetical protein
MLVDHLRKDASWKKVAGAVFWSRDVSIESWRAGILAAYPSYLPDSVSRMSTWHFVRFLGRKAFVRVWPQVRKTLTPGQRGRPRLDVAWSLAATGKFNVPPESALASFPGVAGRFLTRWFAAKAPQSMKFPSALGLPTGARMRMSKHSVKMGCSSFAWMKVGRASEYCFTRLAATVDFLAGPPPPVTCTHV